ncbi:MAG: 2-oxo acid dehydrogenase subunit E2 [Chloroflexi bacterium]|nr:2-oxo acid dehydrogenase subunit E2 [Chloroflexota bacterium]
MTSVEQPTVGAPEAPRVRTLTLIEAVREALREGMRRDERVVVLGEDIGPLGGVFRATDGLLSEFGPRRVIDTPMMELGIAGLAVGMAMRGLRPVAEIQFADFMHAAADHVISDAARIRFRTSGDAECPLVIRTAYGGGLRGGPYHSQSVEAYYAHVPGLRVVAASTPADARGLLAAAIRHPDPVLFLEHKRTYRSIRGEVPEGDYVLPLERATVVRPGQQVTVVAWGWVLHEALAAAEQLAGEGLDVEVIDPRSLNPLDAETLLASVRRTGRLCVVHEDTITMGVGAEIAALAAEQALDDLRAPVARIAMPDVAGLPASGPMEDFLIPDRARVATSLRALAHVDRGQRAMLSTNGYAARLAGSPTTWSELVESASHEIPQASSVVEVDLTSTLGRLEADREAWRQRGIESTFTPYFVEALLTAVRETPVANAAFDSAAGGIRRHAAVHLGVSITSADASEARHGVIRDADTRNVLGLAVELEAIRRGGASDPRVLAQASLCLADYGVGSALYGVPLVLRGQVAAVRIGAVEERLLVRERGFGLAPTAYVCASIDHRALDGMDAGALLGGMKRYLERER